MSTWIDETLAKYGVNTEARVAALALIATNQAARRKVVRQVIDKDNQVRTLTDEYDPSHSEQVKAVDLLNRISGDYDKARHSVDQAADELKALISDTFTTDKVKLRRVGECVEDTPTDDGAEVTGGGD